MRSSLGDMVSANYIFGRRKRVVSASCESGGELIKNRLDRRDVQQPCPLLTRNVLFSLTDKTLTGQEGRSGKDTDYELCKFIIKVQGRLFQAVQEE